MPGIRKIRWSRRDVLRRSGLLSATAATSSCLPTPMLVAGTATQLPPRQDTEADNL